MEPEISDVIPLRLSNIEEEGVSRTKQLETTLYLEGQHLG